MTLAKGLTAAYPADLGGDAHRTGLRGTDRRGAGTGDRRPRRHLLGHPVGAAVALEVLRLYDEGGVLANGQRMAPRFQQPGSTRSPLIRWSAMRCPSACSARSSW